VSLSRLLARKERKWGHGGEVFRQGESPQEGDNSLADEMGRQEGRGKSFARFGQGRRKRTLPIKTKGGGGGEKEISFDYYPKYTFFLRILTRGGGLF